MFALRGARHSRTISSRRRAIARQLETLERRTLLSAAPVAADDVFTIPLDYTLVRNEPALLANDSDADGQPFHISSATSPAHGELAWNADGSFEYTPDAGFLGVDTFTYQITDGTADSNVATVRIRVGDYAQGVLADDPLGYWRLEGVRPDSFAKDSSLNGLDGIYGYITNANPGAIAAERGDAGQFGVGSSYVYLAQPPSLQNLQNNFTVEAWVNTETLAGDGEIFTNSQHEHTTGFSIRRINNRLNFASHGVKDYLSPVVFAATNTWYHVAVALDAGNDAQFFVNGQLAGTVAGSVLPGKSNSTALIGYRNSQASQWHGQLDEVAVYNRVLTANEIAAHFAMGSVNVGQRPEATPDDYHAVAATTLEVDVPSLPKPRYSFSTGFEGTELDPNLEDPNGAFQLADGKLEQVAARRYARTVKHDYLNGDFTYEVDVDMTTTAARIMYVGIGDGVVNGQAYDEPINSVNFRLHTVGHGGLIAVALGNFIGSFSIGTIDHPGVHRTRISKTGNELKMEVDADYNGFFSADMSHTIADLAATAPFLNDSNSNLFFGGDLPGKYDNLYIESSLAPGAIIGVLDNDVGVDGETAALLESGPAHGDLVLNPDGTFTYTPDAGFVGTDTFSYLMDDGHNVSAPATVTLAVNGPPIAVADEYDIYEDTTLAVGNPQSLPVVFDAVGDFSRSVNSADSRWSYRFSMENDHDGDYPLLSVFDPQHLDAIGPWSPGPTPGAWRPQSGDHPWIGLNDSGSDQNLGGINWKSGTIQVHPPYPPLDGGFVAISWLSPGDGELSIQFSIDDANYAALNGVRWYVERNSGANTLANGAFPDGGSSGLQSLTAISVVAGDRINFIVDGDHHSLGDNTLVDATIEFHPLVQPVLANDSDPNGDQFVAELVDDVAHGALDFLPDGRFTYQPDPNFAGVDQFTYRAWDGHAYSSEATVTLNVIGVNDLPSVEDDEYPLGPDGTLSVAALDGVLANDIDADSTELEAILVDQADFGVVTLHADGSFDYVPNPGFAAEDSFTYQVDDGLGVSAIATVTLTRAFPVIDVGAHVLVANAPGQKVPIYVTGGVPVSGLNLFVQVGDGGPERVQLGLPAGVDGPAITNINLKRNSIFAGIPDVPVIDYEIPQVASASIAIAQPGGTVSADGLLATITFDTTGLLAGEWDFKLFGVLPELQGGPFNTDFAGMPIEITNGVLKVVPATIATREVFYAGSEFGDQPAGDKQALLPGQTATFANYTSFVGGINGIAVDIANALGTPTLSDFAFYVGNTNDTSTWQPAPVPSLQLLVGAGVDGADRVVLRWTENAISGKWLMVRVKSTVNTGLAAEDVFYFGNAIGESGDSAANALVNATDVIGTRDHPHGPLNPAAIDDRFDFNRDRLVNATDLVIARDHATSPLSALRLISPSGVVPSAPPLRRTLATRTGAAGETPLEDSSQALKSPRSQRMIDLSAVDAVFRSGEFAASSTPNRKFRYKLF